MATTMPPPALAAPPNAMRERAGRAAEQAGDGEGADAGGAAAGLDVARPPAALEPDQQPDAERDGKS